MTTPPLVLENADSVSRRDLGRPPPAFFTSTSAMSAPRTRKLLMSSASSASSTAISWAHVHMLTGMLISMSSTLGEYSR